MTKISALPSALSADDLLSSLQEAHPEQAVNLALLYETCKRDFAGRQDGLAIPTKEDMRYMEEWRASSGMEDFPRLSRIYIYSKLPTWGALAYSGGRIRSNPPLMWMSQELGSVVDALACLYGMSSEVLAGKIVGKCEEAMAQVHNPFHP